MSYAIEMNNITMKFGNFKANDDVTLKVKTGEVHALIGENGAGKSTLMSVLFGLYQPTHGKIFVNGVEKEIKNPIEANKMGIGMVHQHFKLVDTFTLFENIILNAENTIAGFIRPQGARAKVEFIMKKYNFFVDLDKTTSEATVAEQQRTEILKMLYRDSNILILDEPTAVLTPQQIDEFLDAILNLQKLGKTIIIISHKLDELKKVANSGTVIRRGKLIGYVNPKMDTKEHISSMMVGTTIERISKEQNGTVGKTALTMNNVVVNKSGKKVIGLDDFSMEVHYGEIVVIAGVEGNGQDEIVGAISGLGKVLHGSVVMHSVSHKEFTLKNKRIKSLEKMIFKYEQNPGNISEEEFQNWKTELAELKLFLERNESHNDITHKSISVRYKDGLSYIPEDRHKHGMVLNFKNWENIPLQDYWRAEYSKFGVLKFNSIKEKAKKITDEFDVRSALGFESISRSLSGGNQQKLIVGRELSKEHSNILLVVQPTRGLDVGAIGNIHKLILDAKAQGKAIVLISYELDEVLDLADRIIVVNSGRKVQELSSNNVTKNMLGALMTTTEVKGVTNE